jgi:ATP-dependent RNA helicase DHX29
MQVPQYLLEAATEAGAGGQCSIVCTQPRRIAAISVAERVANERGEPAPGDPGARVGYHVRLDAATTRDTRLLFCTTGILLRRMASDPALASISHVIVDEVGQTCLLLPLVHMPGAYFMVLACSL